MLLDHSCGEGQWISLVFVVATAMFGHHIAKAVLLLH